MFRGCVVTLLMAAAGLAQAASFDCTKAKTLQEKAICTNPKLSAADDELAAAYRTALAAATPEKKEAVRNEQRAWLHATADHCVNSGLTPSTALAECLLDSYQARIQQLSNLPSASHGAFVSRSIKLSWPDAPGESSELEETPGFGTLHATWLQSTIDTAEWQAWNRAVEAATQNLAAGGHEKKLSGEWLKEWAAGSDFEVNASVDLVSQELVTTSIGLEGMGHGAAHPSEEGIEFNWLLKQERELRPEDVFRQDTDWEKKIEAYCSKQLEQDDKEGLYDNWESALQKVVLNSQNWELDGKGLTIDFPEYTVSPRVYPVSPVMIPWTALKPLLQPSFTIPK
jgi:uncharacterized protein